MSPQHVLLLENTYFPAFVLYWIPSGYHGLPNHMEVQTGLQGEALPLLLDLGEYDLLITLAALHSIQILTPI